MPMRIVPYDVHTHSPHTPHGTRVYNTEIILQSAHTGSLIHSASGSRRILIVICVGAFIIIINQSSREHHHCIDRISITHQNPMADAYPPRPPYMYTQLTPAAWRGMYVAITHKSISSARGASRANHTLGGRSRRHIAAGAHTGLTRTPRSYERRE